MTRIKLAFGIPCDITPPGQDGIVCRLSFTAAIVASVGKSKQEQMKTAHHVDVSASRARLNNWSTTDEELIRILYEIGKQSIVEATQRGKLVRAHRVEVNLSTYPKECPFVPSRIRLAEQIIVDLHPETTS